MSATYAQDFETLAENGGSKAPWLSKLRRSAMDRFAERGFPAPREEDWRFTNIAPITGTRFPLAGRARAAVLGSDVEPFLFHLPGASTLVGATGCGPS